jgi:hypothetical protein
VSLIVLVLERCARKPARLASTERRATNKSADGATSLSFPSSCRGGRGSCPAFCSCIPGMLCPFIPDMWCIFFFALIGVNSVPFLKDGAGAGAIACAETTDAKSETTVTIATRFIVKLRNIADPLISKLKHSRKKLVPLPAFRSLRRLPVVLTATMLHWDELQPGRPVARRAHRLGNVWRVGPYQDQELGCPSSRVLIGPRRARKAPSDAQNR